jgi:formylglycine-generating enzyme required for sulfatase activity
MSEQGRHPAVSKQEERPAPRIEDQPKLTGKQRELYERMTDPELTPADRLKAGDELDGLGWLPEDLHSFVAIPGLSYAFHMGKYPVTNIQYQRFLEAEDYAEPQFWSGFPKYDESCKLLGYFGEEGCQWLQNNWDQQKRRFPNDWKDTNLGVTRRGAPVVGITWYEANAYCKWLQKHWDEMVESQQNPDLHLKQVRLPLETEWVQAAGGVKPPERFPWDVPGKATRDMAEVLRCANVRESGLGRTTPVGMYPLGASLNGVWDMAGNVWEWQANFYNKDHDRLVLRGGSWDYNESYARLSFRYNAPPTNFWYSYGFRVCVLPS